MRVVVPLRTGKVTATSVGGEMTLESVSVAELTERMTIGLRSIAPARAQRLVAMLV